MEDLKPKNKNIISFISGYTFPMFVYDDQMIKREKGPLDFCWFNVRKPNKTNKPAQKQK
jgi:hypothetical protein